MNLTCEMECDTCGKSFDDAVDCWRCRSAATKELCARLERYLSALQKVRAAITENASDTIWLREEDAANMTAVECIDEALATRDTKEREP